jgi:hypothetical protein
MMRTKTPLRALAGLLAAAPGAALAQAANANTGACAASPAICSPQTLPVSGTSSAFYVYVPKPYTSVTFQLGGLQASGASLAVLAAQAAGSAPAAASASYAPLATGFLTGPGGSPVAAVSGADGAYTAFVPPGRWVELEVAAAGAGSVTVGYEMGAGPSAGPGYTYLASPQQTMQSGVVPVTVAANTDTLIWAASTSARTLKVIPEASNASCRLNDTGAAASPTAGFAIPGGYVWNLIEPPPNANVHAYCTSAAVIDVSQGN